MMKISHVHRFDHRGSPLIALIVILFVCGQSLQAQSDKPTDHQKHHPANSTKDASLVNQISELRAQMARLQARLDQGHQARSDASQADSTHSGASMKPKMGGGMKGMGMKGSGGKSDMGMNGMSMMAKMKGMGSMRGMGMDGMKMMGMMGGMKMGAAAVAPSALPGFPGASHLYHIGATGFFLDHPDHIKLTTDQQTSLNKAKERALLEQATSQRRIDEAEQELWVLTAADEPDGKKIEFKVRAIEKLKGDQRLAFIRAVGEAAKVLTDQQRHVLIGLQEPGTGSSVPDAKKPHTHTP